jgi:aspartokinase
LQTFEINKNSSMKVFKFGGASLKNSQGFHNVASIIKEHSKEPLLVVVSAIGKTTNALERVVALAQAKKDYQPVPSGNPSATQADHNRIETGG